MGQSHTGTVLSKYRRAQLAIANILLSIEHWDCSVADMRARATSVRNPLSTPIRLVADAPRVPSRNTAPRDASSVLVVDAETEEERTIECGVQGLAKWIGIAAVGTKLICAPCDALDVLFIEEKSLCYWLREPW